jgi:hypothetical protein
MRVNLSTAFYAEKLRENGQFNPLLKATVILMLATGVNRLYTKEDYHLFFKRLLLLGNHFKLIDRFFLDEVFLSWVTDTTTMKISVSDFSNVIGIQSVDAFERALPDEKWMYVLPKMISMASTLGIFSGVDIFKKAISASGDGKGITFKGGGQVLLPDEIAIAEAEIGAQRMLKDIPDELFYEWASTFPAAEKEFDDYAADIEYIKQFDFDALPEKTKAAINTHFKQFFKEEHWDEDEIRNLTQLAWIFANGYIDDDQHHIGRVKAYIDFDESSVELEDGGINLFATCEMYALEDLHDLLKEKSD